MQKLFQSVNPDFENFKIRKVCVLNIPASGEGRANYLHIINK